MSTQKTAPANGATKENVVSIANPKTEATTTPEQKATTPQAKETPELSKFHVEGPKTPIEERINRFLELNRLLERREKITEALDDLNEFQISPTGGANLKLTDGRGKTFAIAHPVVIGEMVHFAKQKLQEELNQVDAMFII